MPLRLGHIELFVRDPLEARSFYRDVLGFEVTAVQGRHVWLRSGEIEILLRPGNNSHADSYTAAGAAIVLYTDDLPATRALLQRRGVTFSGNDGSDKCPTFRDPDGHWFQLVNPAEH